MTKAVVGLWGKSLAVRVPADVARAIGLVDGEAVNVETINGDIVIRRDEAKAIRKRDALRAVEEIREARKGVRLDGLSIRAMIDEGRR